MADLKSIQRNTALEQKAALTELYASKRRPNLLESDEEATYYAISLEFHEQWKNFIR